ncbi:hypothetical protein [Legionella sp. W05-934-2]|uniref:hypothetical protein n=1 Tax=Legionella sp. W05-934-2 TaxID=1198649 RepID=UPI0034624A6F
MFKSTHTKGKSPTQCGKDSDAHNEPNNTKMIKVEKQYSHPSLISLCDAVARCAKALLALGAENNWSDIVLSKGKSQIAGKYRDNWLYLSRTDRSINDPKPPRTQPKSDWFSLFNQDQKQKFFYHQPKYESVHNINFVPRNAASAMMSLTGACDQHAFVVACLLRAILPINTPIRICGLKIKNHAIPHTFVVVGDLPSSKSIHLKNIDPGSLIVVDAWVIQGGAVRLSDYIFTKNWLAHCKLEVDFSFQADGNDHLIKRVVKQKLLHDILSQEINDHEDDPLIEATPGTQVAKYTQHTLEEQLHYLELMKHAAHCFSSDPTQYYGEVFDMSTISSHYSPPHDACDAWAYLVENYPHPLFKRALDVAQERVSATLENEENEFTRLYSGAPNG